METPSSSTRRLTRSQTLAASANNSNLLSSRKVEESEKTLTKSRKKSAKKQQQDRSALIDITNDSPIVGLAMGNLKTPSSAMSKKVARTPGSGEALLRGQVKTLLQKVEEEAELSKITLTNRPFFNSPINIVAPANTPQILSDACLPLSLTLSPVDDKFLIPQMMISEMLDEKKQEGGIECENVITVLDFSEKSSDSSKCSSVLTYQGAFCCGEKVSTTDDDDASSVWSIQVNASSTRDDQEEEECDGDYYYHYEDEEEEEEENDFGDKNDDGLLLLDELCEGISNISVKEAPKFMGKHIRFVYNSDDDEIEGEEKVFEYDESSSPSSGGMLRLKGLPTPKGKHVRFPQES